MTSTTLEKYILAVVTTSGKGVDGGGAPVFYTENDEQLQEISFALEKILDGMAHELPNGMMVIVRHG